MSIAKNLSLQEKPATQLLPMKKQERLHYHPNSQGKRLIIVFKNSLKELKTQRRTRKKDHFRLEKFGGVSLVNQE